MSVDRKSLCPNCGAPLSGLEIKCPECGYVLTSETSASKGTTESILSLQEKLLAVDKVFSLERSSRKKASIINSFPIPNTAEALIRLLHFSYSNYEAAKEAGDKKLSMAWLGKAVESYRRLSEHKSNPLVTSSLDQYKLLGDKKAFSKLSGSRKRKLLISSISLLVIGLMASFILWYDWAGLLVKNGKEETAIRLMTFLGKGDEAVAVLEEEGHYEMAAELLFSQNRIIQAVEFLAQKGLVKEALLMVGKANDSNSIHRSIDALSKFSLVQDRASYYPCDLDFGSGHYSKLIARTFDRDTVFIYYYDSDNSLRRLQINNRRLGGYTYFDYLDVMKDFPMPEPSVVHTTQFIDDYYGLTMDRESDPDSKVIRDGFHRISSIKLIPFDLVYEYSYGGRSSSALAKERVVYKGIPIVETSFKYSRELLSSVNTRYLLSREELDELYSKGEGPSSKWSSNTMHYDYSNGRLQQIRWTLDYYDDFLYCIYTYEYYDNVKFRLRTDIDYSSKERTVHPDVLVEYSLDGKLVESFTIALEE